jgi:serine/threonine protein kinase
MKYVDGETLERWLPAHPSRAERLRLFQKLCDPVSFAHAQGVVHRDLKPANVMIGAFGEVLIMDWGLARPVDEPHDSDEVGTPGYRAPVSNPPQLVAADVFSLGAILFFLLTGKHPPAGEQPLRPRVDPRLDAVCARATHPQSAERYGSVRDLEAEVLRYLDGEAVHAYRERWHERAGRWVRRHQLVLSLILMYLLMRVVVALVR